MIVGKGQEPYFGSAPLLFQLSQKLEGGSAGLNRDYYGPSAALQRHFNGRSTIFKCEISWILMYL